MIDRALGLLVGAVRATRLAALLVTDAVPTDAFVVTRALTDARR